MSYLTIGSISTTSSSASIPITANTNSGSNLNYRVQVQVGSSYYPQVKYTSTWTGDSTRSFTVSFTGLSSSTYYNVNAIIQYKQTYETTWSNSSISSSSSFTTDAPTPTESGTITASNVTYNSVDLTVTRSPSGPYSVDRYNHSTGAWTNVTYGSSGTSRTWTHSGLDPSTTYTFYLYLNTTYSDPVEDYVTITTLVQPVSGTISVSNITATSASVTITRSPSGDWAVDAHNDTAGTWTSKLKNGTGTSSTFTITGLSPNSNYTIYLYKANSTSQSYQIAYTTFTTPVQISGTITCNWATASSINVSWTRNPTGGYSIYRYDNTSSSGWTRVKYGSSGSSGSFTDSGLTHGHEYWYYIYSATTDSGSLLDSDYIKTKWSLTYDANGGTSTPSGGDYSYNETFQTAGAISRNSTTSTITTSFDGNGTTSPSSKTSTKTQPYSFYRWKRSDTSATVAASTNLSMPNNDLTLTAQWSPGTATYTTITLPTISWGTYVFDGWWSAASGGERVGWGGDTITPTYNTTLYAHWIPRYELTYDANGGTSTPSGGTYQAGTYVTLAAAISHNNTTSYNYKTVTFNGNGGTSEKSSDNTGGAKITTHYTFNKWYDNYRGTYYNAGQNTWTMPAANDTLTATWNTSTTTEDLYITLPNATRAKYYFRGWWTDPNGGTKAGDYGDSFLPLTNVILYAHWEAKPQIGYFNWTSSDSTLVVSGQPITNIKASVWNGDMTNKIHAVEDKLGWSHSSVPTVSAGERITAAKFNTAKEIIGSLTGAGSVPTDKSAGEEIKAYYFNGSDSGGNRSLKNALNAAIDYVNEL